MRAIMDAIIGKDITEKLYSIGEKEIEPVLYVGVEGEVAEPAETVQLLGSIFYCLFMTWTSVVCCEGREEGCKGREEEVVRVGR